MPGSRLRSGACGGVKPASDAQPGQPSEHSQARGFIERLRQGLGKTSSKLSDGIGGLFTKRKLSGETLDDLEDVLIESDLGLETAERIIASLRKGRYEKGIGEDDVRAVCRPRSSACWAPSRCHCRSMPRMQPFVILVVGVNGTGKTTTIGKLAAHFAARARP